MDVITVRPAGELLQQPQQKNWAMVEEDICMGD